MLVRRLALLLALLLLAGCTRDPPRLEDYVRLDDPAPPPIAAAPGEARLVALWASWCAPCVQEVPALAALARDPPDGLAVTVVAVGEPPEKARAAFPSEARVIGDEDSTLAEALRVGALPVSFLVRGDRLVARFEGARDWDDRPARHTLVRLLAQEE